MKQKIFALSAVAVLVPALIASQSARAQTFTTLHSFDSTDGASPRTLVQATNGNLFGATEEGGTNGDGTVFEIAKTGGGYASTPTTLIRSRESGSWTNRRASATMLTATKANSAK